MMTPQTDRDPGSFRDPSGFVYERHGQVLRQVNTQYRPVYDMLMDSGLYAELQEHGWLIAHEEIDLQNAYSESAYKVLAPQRVPFISYPYEWSFSQLQDAALLTLDIQAKALEHGLTLKDCSAYNIQFLQGRPVFIDTLSFDPYVEGRPWDAYGQFCRHFLAPLALMAYTDVRLNQLMRVNLDGIPLDLASQLLPRSTYLKPALSMHIHFHARAQQRYADVREHSVPERPEDRSFTKTRMLGLMDSLRGAVQKLKWKPAGTEWVDYYEDNNYTSRALSEKEQVVAQFLDTVAPDVVWDLGANTALFSRLASGKGIETIAFDIDPGAVERAYIRARDENDAYLLPLILDLVNPSPGLGWANEERKSILERTSADLVFALALIHHLVIANNIPMARVAELFARCAEYAIVEFVPKQDSQVQRLLAHRKDIFPNYTKAGFLQAFTQYFEVIQECPLTESERVVYLLRRSVEP